MTDRDRDPLAGVEGDRYACKSCENKATEPGKNHTFIRGGKAYRHFCRQQMGWTRLLPEPAVRRRMVEWLRGESNQYSLQYDLDRENLDFQGKALTEVRMNLCNDLADRLERGDAGNRPD